jgi:hypothetical protein
MSDRRYIREQEPIKRPNPMWKPIGFLLMIIVPIFSFALADMVMKWIILNYSDMEMHPALTSEPITIWGDWIVHNLPATILITVVIAVILFLIISLLNSIMYSLNSDKNLASLNVAPDRKKKKKRKLRDI